jgi:hypothetical protein
MYVIFYGGRGPPGHSQAAQIELQQKEEHMEEKNLQTNQQPATGLEPELLTVRETYLRLRISKWKLYDLFRRRLIDSVQSTRELC